jgi:hypothetical protein
VTNIKNPLNVHVHLLASSSLTTARCAIRWQDRDGSARYHIWVDRDTLEIEEDDYTVSQIYKNPPEGVGYHEPGHFNCRSLKPTAKANRDRVAYVKDFVRKHGLVDEAVNGWYADRRAEEAERQDGIVLKRKEAVADELYAALVALLPLAKASGDYVDPGYQWAIEAVVGARRAIEAADGPVVTLTQNGPAGQYDAYSVDFKGQGGNCHRGLPEAREQAAKLAKKHDAIVVETLKDWRSV